MSGLKRRQKWIALLAVLLLAAVAVVPSTRDALADMLTTGGLRFSPQTSVGSAPKTNDQPDSSVMSLADAQAAYGFDVPSASPEGFVLDDRNVTVTEMSIPGFSVGEALIELGWRGDGGRAIRLSVQRTDPTVAYDDVVAPGRVRELVVNGKSVAVVAGTWDADTGEWSGDSPITVSWRQGDDIYDLQGDLLADLILMAESLPHFR